MVPASRVNEAVGRLLRAKEEILRFGNQGRQTMLELLRHRSPYVRLWAAAHAMPFAEKEAKAVLRNLIRRGGSLGMDAEATLAALGPGSDPP